MGSRTKRKNKIKRLEREVRWLRLQKDMLLHRRDGLMGTVALRDRMLELQDTIMYKLVQQQGGFAFIKGVGMKEIEKLYVRQTVYNEKSDKADFYLSCSMFDDDEGKEESGLLEED